MKKLTESNLVEKIVKRILKEEDNFDPIENALEQLKDNQQYPIEDIAKELGNQTYEILGLSPFQTLKGYRIKQISDIIWGLYDKRVRDHKVAELKINKQGQVVDFKMNPKKI